MLHPVACRQVWGIRFCISRIATGRSPSCLMLEGMKVKLQSKGGTLISVVEQDSRISYSGVPLRGTYDARCIAGTVSDNDEQR